MNSLESFTVFFGWCTALNLGFLVIMALGVMVTGGSLRRIHARMFGLNEEDLAQTYFQYLAHYQTITIAFSLIPYIALKMMA